jgi:hypothetical protein
MSKVNACYLYEYCGNIKPAFAANKVCCKTASAPKLAVVTGGTG